MTQNELDKCPLSSIVTDNNGRQWIKITFSFKSEIRHGWREINNPRSKPLVKFLHPKRFRIGT